MVTTRSTRNGKRKVSSTCFDDMKLYADDIADIYSTTSYKERHTTMRNKISEIKLTAVVQRMLLSKQGCAEVSDYVKNYKGNLADLVLDYGISQPYESYDDMKKELEELNAVFSKTDEQKDRIAALEKEIEDIDDFVNSEIERSKSGEASEKPVENYRRGTIW